MVKDVRRLLGMADKAQMVCRLRLLLVVDRLELLVGQKAMLLVGQSWLQQRRAVAAGMLFCKRVVVSCSLVIKRTTDIERQQQENARAIAWCTLERMFSARSTVKYVVVRYS